MTSLPISIGTSTCTTDLRFSAAIKVSVSENIRFVINEDMPGICVWDFEKNRFFHVDLENGYETALTCESFKTIKGGMIWNPFVFISSDAAETRFIASIKEKDTGKSFLVLFCANYPEGRISICDEYWINIAHKAEYWTNLYKTNHGEIYCIVYWHNEEISTTTTSYFLSKISFDQPSVINSQVIFDCLAIDGKWQMPFIENDALHFLSTSNPKNKLLKILLSGTNSREISVSCLCTICGDKHGHSFVGGRFSWFVGYGGRIYTTFRNKNKCSLWSLKMNEDEHLSDDKKCYMKCEQEFQMNGNISKSPDLQIASNGTAYLFSQSKGFQMDFSVLDVYGISERLLGEGTYGVVMQGTLADKGDVAVKIMNSFSHKSARSQQELVLSAVAEAKKLKTISHQNIVKAYGYKVQEHRFLFFMELMDESVRQKILRSEARKLDEKEALLIVQQALEGLVHLHTLNPRPIVHRDIKCANLLINKSGTVKLGDFGLVKVVSLTSAGSTDPVYAPQEAAGTAYWQAPEVLKSSIAYGRKADVWSIGCCIVEMLTGYPPYHKMKVTEWAIKANDGTLTYNPMELVPKSSADVIILLEKTFKRQTKLTSRTSPAKSSNNTSIRPHSWDILADVVELNTVKPLQKQLIEAQQVVDVIRHLYIGQQDIPGE